MAHVFKGNKLFENKLFQYSLSFSHQWDNFKHGGRWSVLGLRQTGSILLIFFTVRHLSTKKNEKGWHLNLNKKYSFSFIFTSLQCFNIFDQSGTSPTVGRVLPPPPPTGQSRPCWTDILSMGSIFKIRTQPFCRF